MNSIGQTVFELESGKGNFDGQTNGQKNWTNERTELHQCRKEPSYDGDLCPCQVLIRLDKSFLSSSPQNENVDGQTNGQKTDKQTDEITPISKGT